MLIIGFGNKARQGKDSAAEAICEHYTKENRFADVYTFKPTRVGTFKFATALYQEVNQALSEGIWESRIAKDVEVDRWVYCNCEKHPPHEHSMFSTTSLPDWVQPEPNPEVNELAPYGKHPKLLQWWGTEFRRAQDPDYWVKQTFASIPANLDIALITDVRFPNEAQAVEQRDGYNVNVQRLREDGAQYYATDRPVDHPSETALDGYNWDFKLINSAGHQALLGEQAITLAAYLRGLTK
jgi:hypothetical protein